MSAWGMSIAHRSDGLEATMIRFTKSSKDDLLSIDALVKQSEKRIRQGLNPPPEIYRVEYHQYIDWSKFPTWAQPVDPQAYDGCCHEG
jgi:hypothetical protein